jgi:hypothetical protein
MSKEYNVEAHVNEDPRNDAMDVGTMFGVMFGIYFVIMTIATFMAR